MTTHGGKRAGAGRKPTGAERMIRLTVTLTRAHAERLKRLGNDNASAGLRTLLDKHPEHAPAALAGGLTASPRDR